MTVHGMFFPSALNTEVIPIFFPINPDIFCLWFDDLRARPLETSIASDRRRATFPSHALC